MRKTLIILTVGMLAVLLLATPGLVAARGGNGGGNGGGGNDDDSFNLKGTIVSYVCGDEGSLTVNEVKPQYYGDEVAVQLTGDTRFRQCDQDEKYDWEPISCEDLVGPSEEDPGWDVRIIGVVDGEAFVATRVIQYVPAED